MYNNKLVAAIAIGGKIVREQGEKVFLPFSTEYQIFLKNENNRKVLVRIEVDGLNVFSDNSRCVLEAGESHYLSTRMEGSKHYNLKFIEKTAQIEQFRGNKLGDGLIKISYQFVQEKPVVTYTQGPPIYVNPTFPSYPVGARRLDGGSYGISGGFSSSGSLGGGWPTYTSNGGTQLGAINNASPGGANPAGELFLNASYESCCVGSAGWTANTVTTVATAQPSVEKNSAGITVNGGKRDDVFYAHTYVSDPMETIEHVMVLQLQGGLPQINATQIKFTRTKIECSSCGVKNSSNNKFCPNCGTGLEV